MSVRSQEKTLRPQSCRENRERAKCEHAQRIKKRRTYAGETPNADFFLFFYARADPAKFQGSCAGKQILRCRAYLQSRLLRCFSHRPLLALGTAPSVGWSWTVQHTQQQQLPRSAHKGKIHQRPAQDPRSQGLKVAGPNLSVLLIARLLARPHQSKGWMKGNSDRISTRYEATRMPTAFLAGSKKPTVRLVLLVQDALKWVLPSFHTASFCRRGAASFARDTSPTTHEAALLALSPHTPPKVHKAGCENDDGQLHTQRRLYPPPPPPCYRYLKNKHYPIHRGGAGDEF